MSRLDDELKVAFKRKDPPADFVARVLARLDEPAPARKVSWRERIVSFFGMPDLRLAAAAAAALLMIAVAAALYLMPRQGAGDGAPQLAGSETAPAKAVERVNTNAGKTEDVTPGTTRQDDVSAVATDQPSRRSVRKITHVKHSRNLAARERGPRFEKASPEAEAAKEKVLFALQIASDTLNDVQRVIQKDSSSHSEPERNR
jgi:hypothetical protein